jgi:hypothetical protein
LASAAVGPFAAGIDVGSVGAWADTTADDNATAPLRTNIRRFIIAALRGRFG